MKTVSKMTVVCILAVLVVVISSSRYSMIQGFMIEHTNNNAQGSGAQDPCSQPPSQQQEQACQEALMKQDCIILHEKMSGDNEAAVLYTKKGCAGLLSVLNDVF